MTEPTRARRVVRDREGRSEVEDRLVVEEPLEIRLGGIPIAVIMRTPGADDDLVAGFALTEGIVTGPGEMAGFRSPGEGRVELVLADGIEVDPERFRRNLYATSSCGVCGKASIDAVRVAAVRPPEGPMVGREVLLALPDLLLQEQPAFRETGGIHAAAAFRPDGSLVAVREDVGRHNAVDKVVGALAPSAWPLHGMGLLVSGRVSFELVQKAAVAGLSIVAGVSAASSLAVELAEEMGMTVVGFLREGGFTIYCGEERVEE